MLDANAAPGKPLEPVNAADGALVAGAPAKPEAEGKVEDLAAPQRQSVVGLGKTVSFAGSIVNNAGPQAKPGLGQTIKNAAAANKPTEARGNLAHTQANLFSDHAISRALKKQKKAKVRMEKEKRQKFAEKLYMQMLENTLLQTRRALMDAQDGLRVLREEYNWQVRNNQRLEKALRKVQDLAAFQSVKEPASAASFAELQDNLKSLAEYVDRKVNKTIDWQDSRKQPSLLERICADAVMKKRWKAEAKGEAKPFLADVSRLTIDEELQKELNDDSALR